MASSNSEVPVTELGEIYHETMACILAFENCLPLGRLMEEGWAENRLADMKLWASSVGALAHPRSSLDRRLEFQLNPRLVLISLLRTLQEFTQICHMLASAQSSESTADSKSSSEEAMAAPMNTALVTRTGGDSDGGRSSPALSATGYSDLETDSCISTDSDDPEASEEDRLRKMLQKGMKNTEDVLDQLMMLGLAIRKSGTAARLQRADSSFHPSHLDNIRELLGDPPWNFSDGSKLALIQKQWRTLFPGVDQCPSIEYVKQVQDLQIFREHLKFVLFQDARRKQKGDQTGEDAASPETMRESRGDRSHISREQNHLIIANLRRRNRFAYAKRHQQKLAKAVVPRTEPRLVSAAPVHGGDDGLAEKSPPQIVPDPDVPAESAPKASPPPQGRFVPLDISDTDPSVATSEILKPVALVTQDTHSRVSVSTARQNYPSPPPQIEGRKWFKCPCCSQILPEMFRDKERWRKHLSEDLCPYTCPFRKCSSPAVLYISSAAWREHVLGTHGTSDWECLYCAGTETPSTFETVTELASHTKASHDDTMSEEQIMEVQSSYRRMIPPNIQKCPLCPWPRGLTVQPDAAANLEHVGNCIHEFSLRALPWAKFSEDETSFSAERSTVAQAKAIEWFARINEEIYEENEDWGIEGVDTEAIKIQNVDINTIDITSFRFLPDLPEPEATDRSYIPQDYFDEHSDESSRAERASSSAGSVLNMVTSKYAPMRKLDAKSYHVAWICAKADLELKPAMLMLDESHERPDIDARYDDNTYECGSMAGHNVVVATCPDAMTGQVNVSHIVGPLFKTFPAIKVTLLVGIGGGVPQKRFFSQPLKDVRLGDVVVGWPGHADGKPALVYYDSGRSLPDGFQTTTQLNRPHMILLKALPSLRTHHALGRSNFQTHLEKLQSHEEFGDQYKHPGLEHDLLFESTYEHDGDWNSYCVGCDKTKLVERKARTESQRDEFVFHQGRIATGNSVIQDAKKRDAINDQHGDVYCIEMEAAGVDINSNCLVIRGISDYADSHKSDIFRSYAAGKAAAFARELLGKMVSGQLALYHPEPEVFEVEDTSRLNVSFPMTLPESQVNVEKGAFGEMRSFMHLTSTNWRTFDLDKHWIVDRPVNPDFVGRRTLIDKLVKGLTSEGAEKEQRRFVLTGMGGQGKSEICLHVANEVRDRFWGVFWVDVNKNRRKSLEKNASDQRAADKRIADENVSEVAEALGCRKDVDEVKQILSSAGPTKPWLLILDNADDPGPDYQIYMPSGNFGSILVTSRNPQCGHLTSLDRHEELQALDESECVELLCKSAKLSEVAIKGTGEYASALSLVKDLGYHTYAILQAGSYMATAHQSIAAYVELFRTNRQRLLQKSRQQGQPSYESVYTTFEASIEFLERPEIGPLEEERKDALRLLELLSRFHFTSVPLEGLLVDACVGVEKAYETPKEFETDTHCLTAWHVGQAPDLVKVVETDVRFRVTGAVARLESLALVRADRSARPWKSVSMHPLVHGWLGDRQSQEQQRHAMRMAQCIVALSRYGVNLWRRYRQQLAPHLKTLVESDTGLVGDAAESRCILQTCIWVGWALSDMGLYSECYALVGGIAQRLGLEDQKPTTDLRDLYSLLARSISSGGGRPGRAIQIFQAIARLDEETLGANNPGRLTNLRLLGYAYRENGQTKEAVALARKVLKAREENGEEKEDLLEAQHDLGLALSERGRWQKAIAVLEKVVTADQGLQNDQDRLASLHELAVAYLRNGQIEEATPRLEEVARERAHTLGEQHRETTVTQSWLAQAYQDAGRSSDAIALLERVVNTQSRVWHENHPQLLALQYHLGKSYLDAGRTEESISILERIVHFRNLVLEETDRRMLDSQLALGKAYLQAERPLDAIDLLEHVVHVKRSILEDPDLLESQTSLGIAYLKAKRRADAIDMLEQVAQVEGLSYEEGHPERVKTQEWLQLAYATPEDSVSEPESA